MRDSATTGSSRPAPPARMVDLGRGVHGRQPSSDDAVARQDLLQPLRERRRVRDAGAREALEQDRAGAVRHEEAGHLLRRMRRPPAHDADRFTRGRREVPDRGNGARSPGDRDPLAGGRVDLLEVEDAMDLGSDAGRDRRPHDGRERRAEALEPRRPALGREPLPARHPAVRDDPRRSSGSRQAVRAQPEDQGARRRAVACATRRRRRP
jgi:hypothetical protein